MPLSLSTTIGPVHEKPPLHKGWHKVLQQKTGTKCGAYGWWQTIQKHNNSKQHVGQPMADRNAIQKVTPFHKITSVNVWLSHSGQQADPSSAPHHHKVHRRWYHVLEGSAQLTMGDVSGDIEAQDWFPPKSVNPEREGTPSSLSQKSGHLKDEGVTSEADRGNEIILQSELLLC